MFFIQYWIVYGAETCTVQAVDQKHLESFEIWCWRRMEKISWTDHVRNEEVLLRVKEQRNILHEISKRKANWIGHNLRRNCLLQQVIEGKIKGGIEVTWRWGRRCRKLLDDLKEIKGYSYLKEEALDHTMWRACFGPVIRQTTKWVNELSYVLCTRHTLGMDKLTVCVSKLLDNHGQFLNNITQPISFLIITLPIQNTA